MNKRIDRLSAWCHWVELDKEASDTQRLMASDLRALLLLANAAMGLNDGLLRDYENGMPYGETAQALVEAREKFEESEL